MPARTAPLLAALLVLSVTGAEAQRAPGRFRTEFGPGERDQQRPDQLVVSGATYAGADDTSRLSGAVVQDEALQSGRGHQGANVSLMFVRRRPRLSVTATGSSAVRYYHALNRIGTQRHSTAVTGEWVSNPRLTFSFGQNVSYSPSYSVSLRGVPAAQTDAAAAPASIDYELGKDKQFLLGSSAAMKYVFSDAREITAGYGLTYTNYVAAAQRDFGIQQLSGRFRQRLNRALALNLGYGVASGSGTGLRQATRHLLDVGLSVDRSFSFSPRTTIGFSSGSALINVEGDRRFELISTVNVRRRLSPRWSAAAAYERALAAMEGAAHPFAANTFSAELTGFIGARTSVSIRPMHASGNSVADAAQTFEQATVVARAETALGRHWAAYAEYIFYNHQFSGIAGLSPALAANARRHGVRTGISLWKPLR